MRDVIALDGEGISPEGDNGPHLYTILNSYDTRYQRHRYIEDWTRGLDTERILQYLCWTRRSAGTVACTYYGNYDVTMWLKDLSPEELSALWRGGWVVWSAPSGRSYWLEYVPSKSFFVGVWKPEMMSQYNRYNWPERHLLIYDVSGFAQQAFVKTLREWNIGSQELLQNMQRMKEARHGFAADEREEISRYNRSECVALAEYVRQLDATFSAEGIRLHSWHGGGALASHYLRAHHCERGLADPTSEQARDAVMHAYFGGRNELAQQGHFQTVYDYDLNSAYPHACLGIPDLGDPAAWEYHERYDPSADFAVWHVAWHFPEEAYPVGPLPFRYKRGVYYPRAGSGWYHAREILAVLHHYDLARGGMLDITGGWVYHPPSDHSPFGFLYDLAAARVRYKTSDPKRAVPYKLALNSMYGKLAQHTYDLNRLPRWQCYAAAGYVTAATRARLLDMIYADGSDGRDLVMLATDGIFTTIPRTSGLGDQLGEWQAKGDAHNVYMVQAGVWYGRAGGVRSRGYGVASLSYDAIQENWSENGPKAVIPFSETRFVGMGASAGLGEFSRYGRWCRVKRELSFYPDRKLVPPWNGEENVRHYPMAFPGQESEVYEPAKERDPSGSTILLERLRNLLEWEDQPDLDGDATI